MSNLTKIPLTDVLGDNTTSGNVIRVEESWSKDVIQEVGANAQQVVTEFNRDTAIPDAVKKTLERRELQARLRAEGFKPFDNGNGENFNRVIPLLQKPLEHHFFVFRGRKLEYIGSQVLDVTRFEKDISGRFFREWLKKNFPSRKDYDDIVSFDDKQTVKEIVDLLRMCE